MSEIIGIIKEVDSLGRVVIPKEIRNAYKPDKEVEIIPTEDGVFLRNPRFDIVLVDKK